MKKTFLVLMLACTLLLTSCNDNVKGSSRQQASVSSSEPTSSIEEQKPLSAWQRKYKTIDQTDIVGDVDDIEKVNINVGMSQEIEDRDLTAEELKRFKELLGAMELMADINIVGKPAPEEDQSTDGIYIYKVDGSITIISLYLNSVSIGEMQRGELYAIKGGDEMMNFILGLDIVAESSWDSAITHSYITAQEDSGIPTTIKEKSNR